MERGGHVDGCGLMEGGGWLDEGRCDGVSGWLWYLHHYLAVW